MNESSGESQHFSAFWPVWPVFVALCVFFIMMDYAAWQQRQQSQAALDQACQALPRAQVVERTLFALSEELLKRVDTSPTARQLVQELQLKRNAPPAPAPQK